MDTSYLSQQVNTIIGQLHGLFDEIGVSNHERETRESELFVALSEALHNQVRIVAAEKKDMIDEAQKIITTIRQMESSLDDTKARRDHRSNSGDDDELQITYPLTRCLQVLKEKHIQISRLHRERFEQVKKLVQALESYSLHLEPTFVRLALPPTGPNQSIPTTFDLSPSYVDKLDEEFTRVYEEYTHRVATVKSLSENIIQLWAELGTPQAQTDGAIVKYYRDSPEQLGLHEEDLARLRAKRDKLSDEKKNRERRLKELRAAVEALWEKLGVGEKERKAFLNSNRGCGIRQINEFEDQLAQLNELKRQNLHLFVEDARFKLQELWDSLYLSEDEMLEFTPAFSDVYSDALLEAHEREIARLEALKEQRAPTLALLDRHKTLVHDRDELASSSQDASRLMMRGQKGEKRDPGKLLREEKMRKRIAKELPKITAELRKMLEKWEDEYGRPFLVHGERYLDIIEMDEAKTAPGPRSKTPGPGPSSTRNTKAEALNRANSVGNLRSGARAGAKTPTAAGAGTASAMKPPRSKAQTGTSTKGSPSRIPARVPLSNLKHGNNSPERTRPESRAETSNLRHGAPIMRAPPPKMRDLMPPPELETPANPYRSAGLSGTSIVRNVELEDVYDDRHLSHEHSRPASRDYQQHQSMVRQNERLAQASYTQAPPPARQISNTSTMVSGSENWETYDDNSEPEMDASDAYYAKVRAARAAGKRSTPEAGYGRPPTGGQPKRQRGILPPAHHAGHAVAMVDGEGNRIVSGSEWTDEDAF
ncbi:microtubule associated protein-domain-containing protein [Apodospora peruviana]|uniref:Microtubule associated protein-domain-containing protein n=1 Tax=Apodospora peruviana TaxID=516989 RepID=A0AAE0M8U7_9PEZI|nr:microtubule associated protein-domain-containing protein [Apodospora peruviana]